MLSSAPARGAAQMAGCPPPPHTPPPSASGRAGARAGPGTPRVMMKSLDSQRNGAMELFRARRALGN